MKYKIIIYVNTWLFFLFFSFSLDAQTDIKGDANKGKDLFNKNCAACHVMGKPLIGPDLTGIVSRLKREQDLERDWLQKWIKDNVTLRKSGDKYANEVFEKFNRSEMQQFPNLSEQDVDDILIYVENPSNVIEIPVALNNDLGRMSITQNTNDTTQKLLVVTFLVITGLLTWVVLKLNTLVKLTKKEQGVNEENINYIKSFVLFFEKNQNLIYGIYSLLGIFSLYGIWALLFSIGVDKGYRPKQPIYFSHKIHSGINKIDCQLCHSSAKYGKVSGIPSLNTCMNCHRLISEYKGDYLEPGMSREFYNEEIKKIYDYVGWNEATQSYSKIQKPIKWIRIHNMPDFVHFNHAQHIVVGEKAIINSYNEKNSNDQIDVVCKACHGKVDTMNVVEMANHFTMGWCIECHRTTKIDMNNGYNAEYFKKVHKKFKHFKGNKKEVTVDAIGGLECGKCHY